MIVEAGAMVALGDVSHGHSKEITCTRCIELPIKSIKS